MPDQPTQDQQTKFALTSPQAKSSSVLSAQKTESSTEIRISYTNWITPLVKISRVLCPALYLFGVLALMAYFSHFPLFQFFQIDHLMKLAYLQGNQQAATGFIQVISYAIIFMATLLLNISTLFRKQEIVILNESISLPLCFAFELKNRRQRLWSDLASIRVVSKNQLSNTNIVLFFKSGGRATIKLGAVQKDQIEQLGLALELRATGAESLELPTFLDALHDSKTLGGELSFTRMWEDEMNSKFSSVAFLPLAPGQTLQNGDYKIERQLSFGGLCAVYLAKTGAKELVVLKEVALPSHTDSTASAKAHELLQREAALLLRLSHPQIVPIRTVFEEESRTYIVVDHIAGENLRQIIRQKGPVEEQLAIDWAIQLSEILVYLHGLEPPVLHRDISPDNIMVRADGKLVLIDFGVANEFMSSATGTMVGKQSYIAPEQFKGKATPQSDLYALGATLFFLLTSRDPEPLSESDLQEQASGISPATVDFVRSSTRLDCASRISNAEEALQRLRPTISVSRNINSIKKVLHG